MAHLSAIVNVSEPADGILAVTVRCCGDEKTDSVVTIHELHRSPEELDREVKAHQSRVETLHAQKQAAKGHILRLAGLKDRGCGCK
jgi:hypothetical protein